MITITRKIQLNFVVEKKDELNELYKTLYGWQRIVQRAANWIATHHYMQENLKEFIYLTDNVKVKLANIEKDADGILTTSRDSTTYKILSKAFKGECPMGMLSGLNTVISKTFKKESLDVRKGKKSLRTYRDNIPMPVRRGDMSNFLKHEDGNYSFSVYGIKWKTYFGKDLSNNEFIFDSAMSGEYKFCDSSIKIENKRIYLLAVFQFEKIETELKENSICYASLDINIPISLKIGKKEFSIGTAQEFLHRRLAIQGAIKRNQIASRYNKGGKGRKKKIRAIDYLKDKETKYVETKIHQYTAKLIKYCLQFKCSKLILIDQIKKEKEAKDDEQFLLRNWGYYGMKEKLDYKTKKFGIQLIVETSEV